MDVVFLLDETLSNELLHDAKALIGGLGDDMHMGDEYAHSAIVSYGSQDSSVCVCILTEV